MPETLLTKLSRLQSRLALAVFAIPSLVYLATWEMNPYFYGFSVLGFAPVQLVWFLAGLVFAILRVPLARRPVTLALSAAGAASGVVAFAFLKSIHWA